MKNSMAYNPLTDTFVSAPAKPRAELVSVDPTMAGVWLLRNTRNRPLTSGTVAKYSDDMGAQHWGITGDGPKFSKSGVLLNGQHTLSAVIQAGVPVEMFVYWALEEDVQRYMDDGRKRSYSDHLNLAGHVNASALAAITRRSYLFVNGTYSSAANQEPSKAILDDFLSEHPELLESTRVAMDLRGKITVAQSVTGTAHFVIHSIDPDGAVAFFLQLRDGANLSPGSPTLTLRERLLRARSERVNTSSLEVLAWFMRAWDAFDEGRPLKIMRHSPGDAFPLPRRYRKPSDSTNVTLLDVSKETPRQSRRMATRASDPPVARAI